MRNLSILAVLLVTPVYGQETTRQPGNFTAPQAGNWAQINRSNFSEKEDYISNRVDHITPTPNESIATKESYAGPIQIKAVVRLPEGQGDLRCFAYRTGLMIICPTHSQGIGVHIRRPGADKLYSGFPLDLGPTPVSFKDWTTVVWRLKNDGMTLYINDELMLIEHRPQNLSANSPVSLCGCLSTLDVQSFDVTRLTDKDELLLPSDKKQGPWDHLHPMNYQVVGDFIRNSFSIPGPAPAPTLAVSTRESYAGPIEVNAVLRLATNSGADIRFFAFRSGLLLFNPHLVNAPDKLLSIAFRLPNSLEPYGGTEVKPAPCPSNFKDWTKVTWRITSTGMTVLVNDKQFYHIDKPFDLSNGGPAPVRLGGYGGPIDIKSLNVKPLTELVSQETKSNRNRTTRKDTATPLRNDSLSGAKAEMAATPKKDSPQEGKTDTETASKEPPGFFFAIPESRDCAYDQLRQRLYVTTPRKLVIIDTKARKILDLVELGGTLQACDISPDFKFLVIGPASGHFLYRINLDWSKVADMDIAQIKFKAGGEEPGVFSLGVGSEGSVIFTTTYAGSGAVKLRRLNLNDTVDDIGSITMDSMITPSGDRRYAAIAEGSSSNGPLWVYDFVERKHRIVARLNWYLYEIACSRTAKYFARPHQRGCDILDSGGGRMGNLDGKAVICAAFHPKSDTLFVMRTGEMAIQEYDINGSLLPSSYALDKPLLIRGDVIVYDVANLHAVGRDTVIANFSSTASVHYKGFRSGRLKFSEDGEHLFSLTPNGVYQFDVKPRTAPAEVNKSKPKIRVVDPGK